MNANFDTIYNDYNGNISSVNLADNAVPTAKVADSAITTAKVADSNITAPKIADASLTNAKLSTTAGELGGEWLSWTPTYANITVGNGTVTAVYTKVGKTITADWQLVCGSTTSIASSVTVSLPVAAATRYSTGTYNIGIGAVLDSGTALYNSSAILVSSTTALELRYPTTQTHSGTVYSIFTTTIPITEASGDIWSLRFQYEAAA